MANVDCCTRPSVDPCPADRGYLSRPLLFEPLLPEALRPTGQAPPAMLSLAAEISGTTAGRQAAVRRGAVQ